MAALGADVARAVCCADVGTPKPTVGMEAWEGGGRRERRARIAYESCVVLAASTTKYSRLRRYRYGWCVRVRGEQDGGATPSYRSEVLSLTAPQQHKCV